MKKMMFNDRCGLTQAVIEGRKTMTRRLITGEVSQCWLADCKDRNFQLVVENNNLNAYTSDKELYYSFSLPYKAGEIVAVAQSYNNIFQAGYNIPTGLPSSASENKMFVRANLMPHQIRILDVRAQRLRDISDEERLKEGVRFVSELEAYYFEDAHREEGFYFNTPHAAFATLIDKISGKGTWNRNPWVWVYEFELVK